MNKKYCINCIYCVSGTIYDCCNNDLKSKIYDGVCIYINPKFDCKEYKNSSKKRKSKM